MSIEDKKTRVFIKINQDLSGVTVVTDPSLPKKFSETLESQLFFKSMDVSLQFHAGEMKALTGLSVPPAVVFCEETTIPHSVPVYKFVEYGDIIQHPSTKELIVAVYYELVSTVTFPLSIVPQKVGVKTAVEEKGVTMVSIFFDDGIRKQDKADYVSWDTPEASPHLDLTKIIQDIKNG